MSSGVAFTNSAVEETLQNVTSANTENYLYGVWGRIMRSLVFSHSEELIILQWNKTVNCP
jgi:hypothetical protein